MRAFLARAGRFLLKYAVQYGPAVVKAVVARRREQKAAEGPKS